MGVLGGLWVGVGGSFPVSFPTDNGMVLNLELESLRSVRSFCKELRAKGRPLDCLVCNAALYLPNQRSPDFTEDGFERCFQVGCNCPLHNYLHSPPQVNHLAHYLMIRLLLDDVAKSTHKRIIVVGSITGNNNTVGGGAVSPCSFVGCPFQTFFWFVAK